MKGIAVHDDRVRPRAPETSGVERAVAEGAAQYRRVLMITYLFPPGTEMGAQACAQIARSLPRYGWVPVVLTVRERFIEYLGARVETFFRGTVIRTGVITHPFTLYRRVKARLRHETAGTAGGDSVLPETPGLRRWLLSMLAVPDLCTGWILPAVIGGLRAIRTRGVEHLFSSGPPWTSHLVGLALARLSGRPWTAHFRDPWTWPLSVIEQVKPASPSSTRVEAALERMVIRRADAVVCVTDEHTALLQRAYPDVPPGKFVTISNGFDGAEWEGLEHDSDRAKEEKFVITYAGSLYHRRTPRPLFRALRGLIDAGEVRLERIRVDLVGLCNVAGGRDVKEMAAECGLGGGVYITGPLSRAETLRRMARSDLLLLLAEGLTLQIPGKTYEYLRAGRPILALTPEGAVARLLRRTGGAWILDPADDAGVAAALQEAYRAWEDGRTLPAPDRALVSSFDRCVLAGRFAELFERKI